MSILGGLPESVLLDLVARTPEIWFKCVTALPFLGFYCRSVRVLDRDICSRFVEVVEFQYTAETDSGVVDIKTTRYLMNGLLHKFKGPAEVMVNAVNSVAVLKGWYLFGKGYIHKGWCLCHLSIHWHFMSLTPLYGGNYPKYINANVNDNWPQKDALIKLPFFTDQDQPVRLR
jgi:hypothetical protein